MFKPLRILGRTEVVKQIRFVLERREQEYKDKMVNAELYEGKHSKQYVIREARYAEMVRLNKAFYAALDAAEKRIQEDEKAESTEAQEGESL